jgi:hypothetical protein
MGSNERLAAIRVVVRVEGLRASMHGLNEMVADALAQDQVEAALLGPAEIIEDYPDYHKGPCCLVLCWADGEPIHVLVSYPPHITLITVYRPDRGRWSTDFRRRLPKS